MSRYKACIFGLGVFALAGVVWMCVSRPPGVLSENSVPIKREQAEHSVRVFEGRPGLNLGYLGLHEEHVMGRHAAHSFRENGTVPMPGYWNVDALTGEVVTAAYGHYSLRKHSEEPFGPLSRQECRAKAEAFARTKYRHFDSMGFRLDGQGVWKSTGWEFLFAANGGHWSPMLSQVDIVVDPRDGSIQQYWCNRLTPAAAKDR